MGKLDEIKSRIDWLKDLFKERARNKLDNWRRIIVRLQGAETGA